MYQYALVADSGEVKHVMSMGADDDYTSGQVYNGLTAIQVESDVDAQDLVQTKYYADGGWKTREARQNQWQDWGGTQWTFNSERFWQHVRHARDIKLLSSDWTQLGDVYFNVAKKSEWAAYRAALRDVPANNSTVTNIDDIAWPTQPA
tara:strand:+ start:1105 stop:1548 length:444 start_codon:yes stop_codon:yes gene_type:complete